MSDARLFPGWDTMLWMCPPVMGESWGSTSTKYATRRSHRSRRALRDQCREYSVICAPSSDVASGSDFWPGSWARYGSPDGPFLEVINGVIVAEWWRGGRFAPRESYA